MPDLGRLMGVMVHCISNLGLLLLITTPARYAAAMEYYVAVAELRLVLNESTSGLKMVKHFRNSFHSCARTVL